MNQSKEILQEYDKSCVYRTLVGYRGLFIGAVTVLFSLFQLYSTWFIVPSTHMRPIHIGVVLFLTFLLYPASPKMRKDTLPWYDIVLAVLSLAVYLYPVVFFDQIAMQFGFSTIQIVLGLIGILLLFEGCRRVVGMPIIIVAAVFVAIGLFGAYLPGFLGNRGFSVEQIVKHLFYTQEGIFGTPVGASSTFIFLFILFGAFLEKTGVGAFFIDLSNALCGHRRGGPAKVAVITSALEGTISGSSVANTVSTGSFTIPMMKQLGYRPEFAGAVEAAASTGGQLMPPIMGAAAFLMAESLGVPYGIVIKAAVIPALLYFAGIYIIVDLEAKKQGLRGLEKSSLPELKKVLSERGFLMLPLIVIIVMLALGFTASVAALMGIATAIVGSYVRFISGTVRALFGKQSETMGKKEVVKELWEHSTALRPKDYLKTLENGARSVIGVALACGVAGIIAGMITKTGIGLKIGGGLTTLAGGNLFLLLIFTMFASILLGMGVPTTPNYLITSTIMAPIVFKALMTSRPEVYATLMETSGSGIALLPAHLFTFYFGIIADITPPVALAAMAGAAIAKSDPLKTGVNASKLAIAAFLVPYIFVLNPQMLMLNAQWYEIVQIVITSLVGMLGVGMCVEGFGLAKLNAFQRVVSLFGGLMLIIPGTLTDIAGVLMVGGLMFWKRFSENSREESGIF